MARKAESAEERRKRTGFRPAILVRNMLLWLVPVVILWVLLTPFYNRFLMTSGENLLHLIESPNVTQLLPASSDPNYASVLRLDFPEDRSRVYSFRVTDIHYHLLLLALLFLATPGVPFKRRLGALGWAALITIFFNILLVVFWVKFGYATQLGSFSAQNYGPFWRNFWGMGKHLMDLPFKLALPFVLWIAFNYRTLLAARRP
ncbi:MAG: hypothetical protein AAGD01_09090 [Acidobacteriota bacterium]